MARLARRLAQAVALALSGAVLRLVALVIARIVLGLVVGMEGVVVEVETSAALVPLARLLAQPVVRESSGAVPRPMEHATAQTPLGHALVAVISVVPERRVQAHAQTAGLVSSGVVPKPMEFATAPIWLDLARLVMDLEEALASALYRSLIHRMEVEPPRRLRHVGLVIAFLQHPRPRRLRRPKEHLRQRLRQRLRQGRQRLRLLRVHLHHHLHHLERRMRPRRGLRRLLELLCSVLWHSDSNLHEGCSEFGERGAF